jgi:hypothetical protein
MGGFASKFRQPEKKVEVVIERRPPLTMANEVMGSQEARRRINYAIEKIPPGESKRWINLLAEVNRIIEPTEDEPDPLRLEMNLKELKIVLKSIYENIASASSDGIVLMREHFGTIYHDHDFEKYKRISQIERNEKNIEDEMFAYAELNHEVFATIFEKVTKAYGLKNKGIFYDVGCGVGQLVYAAAFIGNFAECRGVEAITPLLEVGERKGKIWNKLKSKFPAHMKTIKLVWENENFLLDDKWTVGSFIVLHWTALSPTNRKYISNLLDYCLEGTMIVSFTHEVLNSDYELLVRDSCRVSWGEVDFFVQIKSSPAKMKPIKKS